ncbi:MAG: hypothetical protein ACRETL_15525, partial [Gammaproteobacteria bacterium]
MTDEDQLGNAISSKVSELRDILAATDTMAFLMWMFIRSQQQAHAEEADGGFLSAPAKQSAFATSLLFSTPQPAFDKPFGDAEKASVVRLLVEISTHYISWWWGLERARAPEFEKIGPVAMASFDQYYNAD